LDTSALASPAEPLVPLSKFWDRSIYTNVRQPGKYENSIKELLDEFSVSDPSNFTTCCELLLGKLEELKGTDVHYLEILPFSSAFDLEKYNDAVINIFTRLNSAGRALEPEEITFAWIKMNWPRSVANGNRPADKCFDELLDSLKSKAMLSLDQNDLVRGMSAARATLFGNGELLRERDLLKAEMLQPLAADLSSRWNIMANAVQTMSERISDLNFRYRRNYFSLNSLFVLWGLECVRSTWNGYERPRTTEKDIFDKKYETLLEDSIDRWFFLSQWAGTWSQGGETEYSRKSLKPLNDLSALLSNIRDADQAVDAIRGVLDSWIENFKVDAKNLIDTLNANSRASVRQYYGPLWIWNRLSTRRWEIAKIPLREVQRRRTKATEEDVDHIVWVKLWQNEVIGQLAVDEESRILNSIGNCCLLEKTFNISKSSDPAYDFFSRVHEFRDDPNKFVELVKTFRLPGSLLRPRQRDKRRLALLITLREQKIKDELKDYIDGKLKRIDASLLTQSSGL
jgi:hypothetical protein